jgi:hypothetical protein
MEGRLAQRRVCRRVIVKRPQTPSQAKRNEVRRFRTAPPGLAGAGGIFISNGGASLTDGGEPHLSRNASEEIFASGERR